MAKLTEYPQATTFDDGDILIKDGVNGTKKILVEDAFLRDLNKATKPLTWTQVRALKSIKDVNAGEYFTASGLQIKQLTDSERNTEISGGNLPAGNVAPEGLTDGVSYIVRSWDYGSGAIAFEIFGTVGRAIWYGGNRNTDKDHFNWHIRSYETYEKDIIDLKEQLNDFESSTFEANLGKNLYDPDDTTIGFLLSDGSVLTASSYSAYLTSGFIPVENGTTYFSPRDWIPVQLQAQDTARCFMRKTKRR